MSFGRAATLTAHESSSELVRASSEMPTKIFSPEDEEEEEKEEEEDSMESILDRMQ